MGSGVSRESTDEAEQKQPAKQDSSKPSIDIAQYAAIYRLPEETVLKAYNRFCLFDPLKTGLISINSLLTHPEHAVLFKQHPFLQCVLEHTSHMDPKTTGLSSPAITFPAFLSVIMLFQSNDAEPEKLTYLYECLSGTAASNQPMPPDRLRWMIERLAQSDPSIHVDSALQRFQQVPCVQAEGGRLSADSFIAMAMEHADTRARLGASIHSPMAAPPSK